MANYYYNGMQQQLPIQSTYYPDQGVKIPANPIGEEGVRTLMSTNNKLQFNITRKDVWEILCHHTHNGDFQVDPVMDENGRKLFKCRICHEIIDMDADISDQDLKNAAELLMIAWQQVKIHNNGTVSADIMYDNAQALAVMRKFPDLFKFVMANFKRNSVQFQQTQTSWKNVGQATYNAIHSTAGFGYDPVYNSGNPVMMQSQSVGNPFQPIITQPAMYLPQQYQQQYQQPYPQQQYQPYPPQQQQPQTVQMQPQYQPQQQVAYSYEQTPPPQPQQPPMPQNVPPPAAAGTVVPEQPQSQQQPPPVAYPPKYQDGSNTTKSFKKALGFNL